jgi:hypothetical protein
MRHWIKIGWTRNLQNMIGRGKEAGAGYQKAPQAAAAE